MFVLVAGLIIAWAVSGPLLGFSDIWQLIINTATTVVTFLMVFIIQNTQNRDSAAVHLKLDVIMDELGVQDPGLYDAENRSEKELEAENERITPQTPHRHRRSICSSGGARWYGRDWWMNSRDLPTPLAGTPPQILSPRVDAVSCWCGRPRSRRPVVLKLGCRPDQAGSGGPGGDALLTGTNPRVVVAPTRTPSDSDSLNE